MTEILGYETTNAMETLATFVGLVSAQYDALEQAITPVDEKIADLQQDWDPRVLVGGSEKISSSDPCGHHRLLKPVRQEKKSDNPGAYHHLCYKHRLHL